MLAERKYTDEPGYKLVNSMWNALDTLKQINPDFTLDHAKEKLEYVFAGWSKHQK